jgi:hypothetical protein
MLSKDTKKPKDLNTVSCSAHSTIERGGSDPHLTTLAVPRCLLLEPAAAWERALLGTPHALTSSLARSWCRSVQPNELCHVAPLHCHTIQTFPYKSCHPPLQRPDHLLHRLAGSW